MWNLCIGKMGEVMVFWVFCFLFDCYSVVVYCCCWFSDKYCVGEFIDICLRKWCWFSGRNVCMCWFDSSVGNGSVCGI